MTDDPVPPQYFAQCVGQFKSLADMGHAFLVISILLAAAFAFLSLIQLAVTIGISLEALASKGNRQKMAEAGGAAATPIPSILDSVKGLIGALSGAPAWFAVFLAGLALIWRATLFTPDHCLSTPSTPAQGGNDVQSAASDSSRTDSSGTDVSKHRGVKPKTPAPHSPEAGGG